MKKVIIMLFLSFFLVANQFSFGINNPSKKSLVSREMIIKNLLVGVKSDNYGLRTSSAFLLGEFQADDAVIELLGMLHKEESDDARIMAALSLLKIEDARGIYAIKQAVKFDTSERVRKICEKFYNHFLDKNQK
ncbi:MAG: HEAT repeat domain-containing protein [Ignavibacterium sp.]